MKKTLIAGLALGAVLIAGNALAATWQFNNGGTGIQNSSHDLSDGASDFGAVDGQARICVFCHHPHNTTSGSTIDGGYSPLWNRAMSSTTFNAYNNGNMMGSLSTIDHTMNGTPAFGGVSLLCMSCHDGVLGMNAYSQSGNGTGSSGGSAQPDGSNITSSAGFVGDMSNHHPIGMNYAAVAAVDGEIADPTATFFGAGVTIGDVMDGNGDMQCVSCHDVHNSLNETGAERFLWTSNNRSAFCLVCHLKDGSGTP